VRATLLLWCHDRPGLVAAVAQFVVEHGGNIVDAEQHTDTELSIFFQRVVFDVAGSDATHASLGAAFDDVARPLEMSYTMSDPDRRSRVAIFMSREPHCTYDLLARWRGGELHADIPIVVSNHADHADVAAHFGVAFHHLPVSSDTRAQQERRAVELLEAEGVDLVVLARYMQVLSPDFVSRFEHRIINIHHSFLPAFAGARPYHQAHERGVKVIGATAHYVTAELDEGPIISQDVGQVSHRDRVADLVRTGRDLEKIVLARAVRAHLEHRVLVYANKTVVFG